MGTQQFCLKWNNHQANMVTIFEQLLSTEALVDVTLACDGLSLRAHKMVLSACSPYFQSLFIENPCKHPIVIMKDMRYTELKAIIDFMYRGEVNVSHDQLNALLRTAETLKVKGLAEVCGERTNSGMVQQEVVQQNATSTPVAASTHIPTRSDSPTLLSKRKRGRPRKRSLSDSNRSDDEQVPSKIKQPESPEIEELSAESLDASEVSQNIGGSNSQTHVPVSSVHNSLRTSIQPSQDPQIEEPSECEFEVEPSKLMEQTLSTDVPVISSKSATQIPSSSVHTSSSALVPSGDSQSLISASVSIASDSLGSSQMQGPDSPQDIKPALLTFEEPPISPVAGTSQENSSMLMYVDPSGVPAIPGTSYQQDSQGAIAQQDSQQGNYSLVCEGCQQIFIMEDEFAAHKSVCSCPTLTYMCQVCPYSTSVRKHLRRHLFTHTGRRPYVCNICHKGFTRKEHLHSHLPTHGPDSERPHLCNVCGKGFCRKDHLKTHIQTHCEISGRSVKCSACGNHFNGKQSLANHLLMNTSCLEVSRSQKLHGVQR